MTRQKQSKTYIADRVDVDVVLGILGVRHKGLDEKVTEDTSGVLNLLLLGGTLGDPGLGVGPGLVEGEEAALATALDELVGLCDKLGAVLEEPRVGDLGLVKDVGDVGVLGEAQGGEPGGGVVLGGLGERAGLDGGGAGEVVVEDGLAVGLEDCLGRHVEVCVWWLGVGERRPVRIGRE